jgi:hypothetical protein
MKTGLPARAFAPGSENGSRVTGTASVKRWHKGRGSAHSLRRLWRTKMFQNVAFPSQGATLRGRLYIPEDTVSPRQGTSRRPAPIVFMARRRPL